MIYRALLRGLFSRIHGDPIEVDESAARALVVVADGVGGFALCSTSLRHLVGRAGSGPAESTRVETLDWGHGLWRWYADLTRVDRHAEQAARLAERVASWNRTSGGRPAALVGKSGGAGIVVKALEQCVPGSVENVVLLAPALSPGYDLAPALRAVRGEMVVFWSPLDLIILGLGTSIFGTIDRKRTPSAGLLGFRVPREGTNGSYARLRQIRWRPSMIGLGYLGGHIGPDLPGFLRVHVLPIVTRGAGEETRESLEPTE
jgi:hypothetical protein